MADGPHPRAERLGDTPRIPDPGFSSKVPDLRAGGAIVFRQIREYDVSVKGAPLVCLECCLETHDRE